MKHGLLQFLCCPDCKKSLKDKKTSLFCVQCDKSYAISHGIPVLVNLKTLSPHIQKQIEYFENEDKQRSKFVLEPWQTRYVKNFLKYASQKGVVVDNATGSGYMAIELAKKGFDVIATDLTMAELIKLQYNIKRLKLEKRILLVCASSESLPIRSGVADGMVANAILEHLPNEKGAIKEIERVLKNGATLMLAMPIKMYYVFPLLWPVNMIHDKNIGHLRRYTRSIIRAKFSKFAEHSTYYTGSLAKVFCLFLSIVTRNKKWNVLGERLDAYFGSLPLGASNVVSILKK